MVRAELAAQGYSVVLTRTTNVRMPILTRAEIALALAPEVFVSIHHNGGTTNRSPDPGTVVFHQAHNPESMRLAGILFEEVQGALSQYDVAWAKTSNQGTRAFLRTSDDKDLYGILRLSEGLTSVIVEPVYLSKPAGGGVDGRPGCAAGGSEGDRVGDRPVPHHRRPRLGPQRRD